MPRFIPSHDHYTSNSLHACHVSRCLVRLLKNQVGVFQTQWFYHAFILLFKALHSRLPKKQISCGPLSSSLHLLSYCPSWILVKSIIRFGDKTQSNSTLFSMPSRCNIWMLYLVDTVYDPADSACLEITLDHWSSLDLHRAGCFGLHVFSLNSCLDFSSCSTDCTDN